MSENRRGIFFTHTVHASNIDSVIYSVMALSLLQPAASPLCFNQAGKFQELPAASLRLD